jgi:hypothetical protein
MRIGNRRVAESVGMLMIGEGVLGLTRPEDHCRLWRGAHGWWSSVVEWFVEHPTIVRTLAVLEIAAGFWLAFREERAPEATVATPAKAC